MADPITREQVERAAKPLTMNQMADALVGSLVAAGECDPEPAPEVVDVPQPLVKRFGGVEASWGPGRLDVITLEEINGDDEPLDVPIALLRAMLEAIDAQQQPAPAAAPTRPEPRYKVGDWVRVQHHGTVYQIGEVADPFGLGTLYFREKPGPGCTGQSWAAVALTPALDPALHETARKTVAILRKSTYERLPDGASKLPMFREWNNGPVSTREWAAQLERLLGDAP